MKTVQSSVAVIGGLIITILSQYYPIAGIKIPNAIYCDLPAGLPFAYSLGHWMYRSSLNCLSVLPAKVVFTAFVLDLIVWSLILFLFLKILARLFLRTP